MSKCVDLSGQRYGRLSIIERAESKNGYAMWVCKCECGNKVIVIGHNLRIGATTSCGCLQKEKTSYANSTHKLRNTRIYTIWTNMKQRCENSNNKAYGLYGAEGKTVCAEWKNFELFYKWAISHGYADNLTIERIDNTKGYSSDNCKWATMKEQENNTRRNHLLTYNNETHTIAQWSEIYNMPYNTLFNRLERGWSIKRALSTPNKLIKRR